MARRRRHGRLSGPADVKRIAQIARTLPPGAVVVETATGGEITLPDGRRARWRCGRSGTNVFETIADRNRRERLWMLPQKTKDAIHVACATR